MKVLVTGGAGYIGSHTIVELCANGHDVVVVDNLCNSSEESLRRVAKVVGKQLSFYRIDLADKAELTKVFDEHPIDAVIHFAALKSVNESVAQPLRYYGVNLGSTIALCEVMAAKGVKKLIFSSTAAVYGTPKTLPIKEDFPVDPESPYGRSKYMIEQILSDLAVADPEWHITILRYFNPVGAHISGTIGEDPGGIPANILPYISQVAVGTLPKLKVFGDDWDTPDGTGVRDFIHVVDLASGHVAALEHIESGEPVKLYNLGTGRGTSVKELITAFEKASGKPVPYEVAPRRPGDIGSSYADPTKANSELGWVASKTIQQACEDAWRWQSNNPSGFNRA